MTELNSEIASVEHSLESMQQALRALGRLPPEKPFAPEGLVLKLVPREEGLQSKEVPVAQLFKKVVSFRDKLRVLEQRVNASELSLLEKTQLQARITLLYDAMASFVAFFSEDALPAELGADGDEA